MAKRRVNKSKLVRDYLAEHPTAGPKEVAEALSKHKISAAYVSNIKFKMTHGTGEANGKPTRRSSKGKKATRATGGSSSTADILAAAQFIRACGGIESAKRALQAAEELAELLG